MRKWKRHELEADRKPTKAERAEDVILAYMADHDDVITNDLKDHLRNAGFGKVATDDAVRRLGTSASREARGKWFYTLK